MFSVFEHGFSCICFVVSNIYLLVFRVAVENGKLSFAMGKSALFALLVSNYRKQQCICSASSTAALFCRLREQILSDAELTTSIYSRKSLCTVFKYPCTYFNAKLTNEKDTSNDFFQTGGP